MQMLCVKTKKEHICDGNIQFLEKTNLGYILTAVDPNYRLTEKNLGKPTCIYYLCIYYVCMYK